MKFLNVWFIFFVLNIIYCWYAKYHNIPCTEEWFTAIVFLILFKIECVEDDLKVIKNRRD